jgi:hypothetical protein
MYFESIEQLDLFELDHAPVIKLPERNDIRTGDAGETYVHAKLLRWGFDAVSTRREARVDTLITFGASNPCLIQTKTRRHSGKGTDRWNYSFTYGNPRTGLGARKYAEGDFHISACVALSLEKVLFVAGVQPVIRFSTADFLRPNAEFESLERALNIIRCAERN